MQTFTRDTANTPVNEIPESNLADAFIYQESPSITRLLRAALATAGGGLGYLLLREHLTPPFDQASAIFWAILILAFTAIVLARQNPIHFICTPRGLYFPESAGFWRSPRRWLLVSWKNVIGYRVQRMIDETSSNGIVLTIRASHQEERQFFSGRRLFRLSALQRRKSTREVLIGYTTFIPRPDAVLYQLQRFDAMHEETNTDGMLALSGEH